MEINADVRPIKGKIIELTERDVKIEFYGRMGMLRIPLRMLICDKRPEVGDDVELEMSYVKLKSDGR
ncbi:MAG: hypothetical protein PWP45_391 [Tepidanaerobacteraceae bacterium]|nr:hypothetical protein [Tepidanaerobacteraceae bacterium]